MKTKDEILQEEFKKFNIVHGCLPETKQAVLNAMDRWAKLEWKDPVKDGFPPEGTECVIRKDGDIMIGVLQNSDDDWDDWVVNFENVDCVDEYLVLPK